MHFLSIAVNQFIELATSGIFIQEKEMQEVQKNNRTKRKCRFRLQKKKWKRLFPIITLSVHGSLNTSFFLSIFFLEMWNRKPEPMKRQKKISHYWISFSKEIGLFLSIKIQVHSFPYSIHSAISWVAKHLRCTTTLKLDWKEEKFTKNKYKM